METHSTTATGPIAVTPESKTRVVADLSPAVRGMLELMIRMGTGLLILLVTVISVVTSLIVTVGVLSFMDFDDRLYRSVMLVATIVPTLVAPPITYVFSMLTDHLFELEHRLQHQASHDSLTGVPNRDAIMTCFFRAVQAPPQPEGGIGVLMIDIDHFKSINDNHGHDTGDRVLKVVATTLAASLRKSDRIGRYGGEEFLVLTPESSPEGLRATAERLRTALSGIAPATIGIGAPVTASVGGAIHLGVGSESAMSAALQRADQALYRAKRSGRDRVEIAGPGVGDTT